LQQGQSEVPAAADDLSPHRWRQARWAAAANLASKLSGMLVMVAGVRLTLPYLGDARFGAWMLLSSLIAMLSFMDLGVGNALTNRVATAAAAGDAKRLKHTISGGLLALAGIAAVTSVLFALFALVVPWERLLRDADAALLAEARDAGLVFAALFGITLFGAGVQKVLLGLQRSFEAHIVAAAASLVVLFLLFQASAREAGIASLIAVTAVGQLIAVAALLARLALRGHLGSDGAWSALREETPKLLRTGGLFFMLQIGSMVGWGADSLIVSATLGSAQVAVYAVVQRLFMFASLPPAMFNQPLWGSYADAHARGDRVFLARTLRVSVLGTVSATTALALLLTLLHGTIIEVWTHSALQVAPAFLIAFAIWTVLEATATCVSMYLNGCNVVRPQVFAVLVFCALSIPLKLVFAQHWGLTGVVICTIVSYLVAVPLLYALFFRREIAEPLRPPNHEHTN
jgi:O-antigen/teichoic acid export membrane protein